MKEEEERVVHTLLHFRHFDDVLLNLRLDSENCFVQLLVYLLFFLLLLFSIPLLTPEEDQVSKALVFFIFFVCRRVGTFL